MGKLHLLNALPAYLGIPIQETLLIDTQLHMDWKSMLRSRNLKLIILFNFQLKDITLDKLYRPRQRQFKIGVLWQ